MNEKQKDALGLFIESVHKPDHELRQCAHNQKCYYELLEWQAKVLEYLQSHTKYFREHSILWTTINSPEWHRKILKRGTI